MLEWLLRVIEAKVAFRGPEELESSDLNEMEGGFDFISTAGCYISSPAIRKASLII